MICNNPHVLPHRAVSRPTSWCGRWGEKLQIPCGNPNAGGFDGFGGAGGNDGAALGAAFRAHVNQVVGVADDIEVVLDDNERIATVNEAVEHIEQDADVVEMQAGGGLVENVERFARIALGQFGR